MYCIAWNCEEMYTLVIYMKYNYYNKKVIRIINNDIFIIRNGTFILIRTHSLFSNYNILKL